MLGEAAFRAEEALARLDADGCAVIPAALSAAQVERIGWRLDAVCRAEREKGNAWLEPPHGQRSWMLLNKGAEFVELACDERLVGLADTLIGAPVLLSNVTANVVGPQALAQAVHTDQGFLPDCVDVPMTLTAIWLLDAFTSTNGATQVLPGSHRPGPRQPARAVVADAGSVLLIDGRLEHGAGRSAAGSGLRRAVIVNYCSPVLRQQENVWRSLDPAVLSVASPLLMRLLGASIHDTLGMVGGLPASWRPVAATNFGESWR